MVAVEPQPALRERLAGAIGADRVREVAEAIPLADGSVAAVTAADGFHWFDAGRALPEIRRVLVPGGGLAVLTSFPDWSGASWAHELGTLIESGRPEHPFFDGPPAGGGASGGGWGSHGRSASAGSQPADPGRIVDYVASMSWVAGLPEDERARMLAEVARSSRAARRPRS